MARDLRYATRRVAGVLACATCIATLTGCHQRSRASDETVLVARRFSGVDLVPTRSGGFYVRILSGLVGSGEPLYVIDGNPLMIDPGRGIDWFKPEDILRITVLKNPSDLAVYGARGVNGVILITTRQATGPKL